MDTWLTDTDIEAVLAGDTPPVRPELVELRAVIDCLEDEFPVQLVAWPAELGAVLDPAGPAVVQAARVPARRRLVRWVAGVGLAGQASLVSAGAAAAIATGGFAGVLPDPGQRLFDSIVHRGERPPATSPSTPKAPLSPTPQEAGNRRTTDDDTPGDRGVAEQRRPSPDRAPGEEVSRRSGRAAPLEAGQLPVEPGSTDEGGGDGPVSQAPVAPTKPGPPAVDRDDDVERHLEDRREDAEDEDEDAEDEREDAEDERQDLEDERQDLEDGEPEDSAARDGPVVGDEDRSERDRD